jgi:hypothetical protein
MSVREKLVQPFAGMRLKPLARRIIEAAELGEDLLISDTRPSRGVSTNCVSGQFLHDLLTGRMGKLHFRGICLTGLYIDGDIDLSFLEWRGQIALRRCHIHGSLILKRARVTGEVDLEGTHLERLYIQNALIDGNLRMREGFHAAQGIYAIGVTITGTFSLRESSVAAPANITTRMAIELYRAKIGDMFLQRSIICGGIYASRISVEKNLRLQGAAICSRTSLGWEHTGEDLKGALVLLGAEIRGSISFATESITTFMACGTVNLNMAKCGELSLPVEVLERYDFAIDGLVYTHLVQLTPNHLLGALNAKPDLLQNAYVQLASYAGAVGDITTRRRALQSLEMKVTRHAAWRSPTRWWREAYGLFVGYGYSAYRAIIWLLAIVAAATLLLHCYAPIYARKPATGQSVGPPQKLSWSDSVGVTLDGFLPFAGLNTKELWIAAPQSPAGWVSISMILVLRFAAWGLVALAVLSFNNVIRNPRA